MPFDYDLYDIMRYWQDHQEHIEHDENKLKAIALRKRMNDERGIYRKVFGDPPQCEKGGRGCVCLPTGQRS